jgi:hypothetical protein
MSVEQSAPLWHGCFSQPCSTTVLFACVGRRDFFDAPGTLDTIGVGPSGRGLVTPPLATIGAGVLSSFGTRLGRLNISSTSDGGAFMRPRWNLWLRSPFQRNQISAINNGAYIQSNVNLLGFSGSRIARAISILRGQHRSCLFVYCFYYSMRRRIRWFTFYHLPCAYDGVS